MNRPLESPYRAFPASSLERAADVGVGIDVGEAVGDGVAADKVGMAVATWVGAVVVMGVAVRPLHASTVIASAVISEINTRLFMSFTGVLISFPGEAQDNHGL